MPKTKINLEEPIIEPTTKPTEPQHNHLMHWMAFLVVSLGITGFLMSQISGYANYVTKEFVATVNIAHAATTANLSLSPSSGSFGANQNFTVSVILNTGGSPVDGVDLFYLNFNPAVLQVVDDDSNTAGVQITSNLIFPSSSVNSNLADNSIGRIAYSQVSLGINGVPGQPFTGTTTIATIHFHTIAAGTSPATFDFTLGSTSDSNAAYQGVDQLGSVTNGSFTVDTTAPTVSITSPSSGATVSGTTTVSATASDNVGVVGVQFKLDGANLGAESTVSPYSTSWTTAGAGNGAHTLTAVARDAAGNTTTSSSVSVTVNNGDTTPPTVSITAPTGGSTVSGTTTTVSATAADNVGVVGVQFKLDGANLGAEDTTSPYSIVWNTTTASNASHTLTAVARDAAGNTTTSSSVSVTVNNVSFDFSMSNGGAKSVTQGSSVTNSVTATLSTGTTTAVSFSASGLPSGVSAAFSPTSCSPTCTTTLTLTASSGATVGVTTTTVTGTAGATSHTTTFSLTVSLATFPRTINISSLDGRGTKIVSGTLNVLNTSKTLLKSYAFTTDASGNATITFDIPVQTAFLQVQAAPFLTREISQDLSVNSTYVFSQLLIGDIVQDNIINSVDYSVLNTNWFTSNAQADLNQDGLVNSIDFSLMNKHWLVSGEQ